VCLEQWVGLVALTISLYILWQIRQVLLLIFAAVVFATALNRLVKWLQRYRFKRGIATILTVLVLAAILAGILTIIVPRLVEQFQQLAVLLPQVLQQQRTWLNQIQNYIPEQFLDFQNLGNLIPGVQSFVTRLFGNIYSFFSDFTAAILSIFFVVALTIMLLLNPQPYRQGFILIFPSFYRKRIDETLVNCETTLVGWISGTLINMLAIAVVTYIGLLLLGIPLPLINALIAGLLEFIPNIGPVLSVIPPALIAMTISPWKSIAVIVLYLVIQQLEAYLLVPFVMNNRASLLPAVTLCAVVIFGAFFGFPGVFLAVPLVIVAKIWLQEILVKDIMNAWQRTR
jgi:predicted PurR-regulated permease PerM